MARLPGASALGRLIARLRSVWRGMRRRGDVEREMVEEFRHHLELRTEDLIRQGVSAREAARRAKIEFGGIEGVREDARAARGLYVIDRIGFSWLDTKLGLRMLVRYPGLSLVSVLGMSIAIAVGAGGFGLIHALVDAPLPLDEGERVISVQNSNVRNPGSPARRSAHDFIVWREEVRSLRDLAAFRGRDINLTIPDGGTAIVRAAEMTASGFRVARVAPVLGRVLLEEDERPGATRVMVIGWEEWQQRFGGDAAVVGREVRVDSVVHTIVGVMPEGFHFPVDHRYWLPLRLNTAEYGIGEGPEIMMFARLAEGVSAGQAQIELAAIGARMAAEHPETHADLRPTIRPYTHPFIGLDSPARGRLLRAVQYLLSLLLVVVSTNVAILVYARTAARMGEIAVRSALGASRRRVITQLFAEALILSLAAAAIGLAIATFTFDRLTELLTSGNAAQLPFWVRLGPTPSLIAYTTGLAVVAAVIVGVVPGLKATGRALHGTLQQLSSRGARMRLGRTWTVLVVLQVAVAVAVLPYALWTTSRFLASGSAEPGYAIDEFVHATIAVDVDAVQRADASEARTDLIPRFESSLTQVQTRLQAEPGVAGIALATGTPGSEGAQVELLEMEGTGTRGWVWVHRVDAGFLPLLDVPILAGRKFVSADQATGTHAVIVDRVFADEILGGGDVIGRRIRRVPRDESESGAAQSAEWLEVVGVVPAFTPPPPFERSAPRLYEPLRAGDAQGVARLIIRARRGIQPGSLAVRIREVATGIDPALRVTEIRSAADEDRQRRQGLLSLALSVVVVMGSVLLLSAAGIYAMMSFAVVTRRREIAIRSALGAAPRRVLIEIFRRAGAQLGAGALGGLLLAELVARVGGGSLLTAEILLVPSVVALVLAVGLLAAVGPARRGLTTPPTDALREE